MQQSRDTGSEPTRAVSRFHGVLRITGYGRTISGRLPSHRGPTHVHLYPCAHSSHGCPVLFSVAAAGKGHSSLYVAPNPACDGIRQDTSYDYVFELFSIQIVVNIRLDFEVNASAARAGEPMTVHAHGAITSLHADNAFGPRQDTRVYLSIPAGVDLDRSFEVQASINDGVPISSNLDVASRMLVLSTGRIEGAPAEIDLHVTGYVNAARTQPISWNAPKLQMDIESGTGAAALLEIVPDRGGPPVLTTPLFAG